MFRGLQVTQRAAGANNSVDVSAGSFALLGNSQIDQGMYFARSTGVENVLVPATPGANTVIVMFATRKPSGSQAMTGSSK